MRRLLATLLVLSTVTASAQEKKAVSEAELKKRSSTAPDTSLAGDLTRKKDPKAGSGPTINYDQFRAGVELQVASKRREQIESLKKIISLSPDQREAPSLLFRLGELYWEESKYFFFEAERKDEALVAALEKKDKAAVERIRAEKEALQSKSKQFSGLAMDQYKTIVQKYRDYERTDEVLFFLGKNMLEAGEDRAALIAFKRLVDKFPKSKYLPDAHLAFGEYYFNNSKGKRELLQKALESYKNAAAYPENQVYAFALYKQGWCHFNLGDFQKAMDMFKTVVLYGELAGAQAVEKDGGKSGKNTLVKEARNDFVRAYAQIGTPEDARAEFGKVASKDEDRFNMMKQLANLYYDDGKDRDAAVTFNALIKEKPLSPEAPGFQSKIVDCVIRAPAKTAGEQKRRTVGQVRRLVKIVSDVEKSGVIKTDKDKNALDEARDLSERTLSNLAVTWHNEGKKTRDEETFGYANDIYSDYLTLFPENPKAYDLRFFWAELLNDNLNQYQKAADNYTVVLLQDAKKVEGEKDPKNPNAKPKPGKPGKFMVNAAFNAILAYEQVVKGLEDSGKLKAPEQSTTEANKKIAIPGPKQALLDACERYLKFVPNATPEDRTNIAFKAANIYYRYNHFDEAVLRFSELALSGSEVKAPTGERVTEVAANLVLDSYNLQKNWSDLNKWARRFYANQKLASGEFRATLAKVLEQSSFKLVNELEEKKEFARAAEAYLNFVSEFPKSEIADQALYNASIDYFSAKMLDKAIAVRAKIISQYPQSSYVPKCVYNNAEAHELIGDFDEAADGYEAYVRGFERSRDARADAKASRSSKKVSSKRGRGKKAEAPKAEVKREPQIWEESKAQVALYNAGVFREGLSQFKQALKDREWYLALWPTSKDSEAIFLSIADLYEKSGAYGKAMKHLEEYERKYTRDPSKVLAAEGRIAKLFEEKLRKPRDANRIYGRVLKYYDDLPSRQKRALEPAALAPVAQGRFLENETEYAFYSRLRLSWGRPASPQNLKKSIQEKKKSLDQVERIYKEIVALKSADAAVCAVNKIAEAYGVMADSIANAPMPPGLDEETQGAVREQFGQEAAPVRNIAGETFAVAVQTAQQYDTYNACYQKALKALRTEYKPDQFPEVFEDRVELKSAKPMALGRDLLTAIQPIPVRANVDVDAQKAQAAAVADDLSDLNQKLREAPRPEQQSNEPASEPQDPKGSSGSKSSSDEPEDFL